MNYYYLSTTSNPADKMQEPRILTFGTYTVNDPDEKYITFSTSFSQTPKNGATLYVFEAHATLEPLAPVDHGNLYNTLGHITTLTFVKKLGPTKYVVK